MAGNDGARQWLGMCSCSVLLVVLALTSAACGDSSDSSDKDTVGGGASAAGGGSTTTVGNGGAGGGNGGATATGGNSSSGSGGQGPPPTLGPAGHFDLQITVDGVLRKYVLDVPQSAVDVMASGPVPMLFAFHGAGDSASNFVAATKLASTASTNAFVVATPDGYNKGWFVQKNEGWPGADGNNTSLQNDVQLALDILNETGLSYYLDAKRLYAVGHSRGAGFTGLLATTSGQMMIASGGYQSPFAAYGVNASYDPTQGAVDPTLSTPKRPVWVIHGSGDSVVPPSYGKAFADALTAAGWDVTMTSVPSGPHTWLWRSQYGQTNQDLWDYFASHELP